MKSIPFFKASTPFGPFQNLHEYVINNAEQITLNNWYKLFIIPLIPLYIQAFLLRYEKTRNIRISIGLIGIILMSNAGCHYRFTQPWLNAINNGIGIGIMHLIARYLEFSFIQGPIIDRYFESKGRHPLISALDIAVNARWIGLGSINLDNKAKVNSGNNKLQINGHKSSPLKDDTNFIDGGIKLNNNKSIPEKIERKKENWLPWPKIKRTKFQSVKRHLFIAIKNYIIFDTCLHLIRFYGSNTIGSNYPISNAFYKFSHENQFIIFPILKSIIGEILVPWWIIELITEISVAIGVWLGISCGYHLLGCLLVGSGIWETDSWEIDIFDNPLKSDSLLDFWGRRWHQFFRHHFILYSTLVLRLFHLKPNSGNILFMSFILSGAMHSIGQFTMNPHPPLLPIFLMFPLSGIGCIMEVIFKRMTGRKVRGSWGRPWTWIVMLSIGRLGTVAWLDSGVGGSYLTPPFAGKWITDNLLDGILIGKK
ncbi:uncharacterized protein I206_102745 [Kwoniella pini CBS 10737]|uniref:Wax synthase domain-containing protein n=1 Tax=Kwoniella pini CBS 10737 TaxID=1296096 RepID=A0A1B9I672_9TREE|nr:uncharacterized protein I206_03100 [Kwoniella pini CBS 10737]OCF51035.1 hypothetical protein I206_03100 [Kwoniella pini CBS 10737]